MECSGIAIRCSGLLGHISSSFIRSATEEALAFRSFNSPSEMA
jgi:hypothetical protein